MSRFCTVPVADPVVGENETYAAVEYFTGGGGVHFALWPLDPVDLLYAQRRSIELELGSANADRECGPGISGGSRISPRLGGPNLHTILPNFPKNCMKLKAFGPGGRSSFVPP